VIKSLIALINPVIPSYSFIAYSVPPVKHLRITMFFSFQKNWS